MLVVFALIITGFVGFGWTITDRRLYESARYAVVETDGPFEVREYPDLMLAATTMRERSSDGSFGRLFQYISGNNEEGSRVAMTTPVFMEDGGSGTEGTMAFVVPEKVALDEIPVPKDEKVVIQRRTGGRFAVVRFSGQMEPDSIADAEARLRIWMQTRGLRGAPEREYAGYDPPWTPGPLRRNEVLIRLE